MYEHYVYIVLNPLLHARCAPGDVLHVNESMRPWITVHSENDNNTMIY